ncbi:MAG TPA: nucleotide exchange factor GrpE [Fervidobacterium sp.]|nr:nucleotide exchange factor GrpE [Fervidobacterium sp.]HUM76028.1 nucleotide exchange factor GrpE [Fervidobacterium sp.]
MEEQEKKIEGVEETQEAERVCNEGNLNSDDTNAKLIELSEENKQLKDKIADLEEQLKEIQNAARLIKASFENYKMDVDRQLRDVSRSTALRIMKVLIPIVDDFKRAFKHYETSNDLEEFYNGTKKIFDKFTKTLENEGLKVIDTSGKFDPFNHEALDREERDDVEEYSILEILEDGYTFNGQVVKPTKVKVAVKPRKPRQEEKNVENDGAENQEKKD